MKIASITLAIVAFVAGLRAAHLWYRASRVLVIPMWDSDGRIEPVDPSQSQSGWIVAMLETAMKSSTLNRRAALWTAATVFLGTASTLLGAI